MVREGLHSLDMFLGLGLQTNEHLSRLDLTILNKELTFVFHYRTRNTIVKHLYLVVSFIWRD